MASTTLITVADYLARTYQPDMDYDEGVLVERIVGKRKHSRLQSLLIQFIGNREEEWGITVYPEQRIQVAPRKFCVADVCATIAGSPLEDVFTAPPLFVIEILSDGDVFSEVEAKAQKYLSMGVQSVWTVDPQTGRCWRHSPDHSMDAVEGSLLEVSGTLIHIPVAELVRKI